MDIRPLNDRIVVKCIEASDSTARRIFYPGQRKGEASRSEIARSRYVIPRSISLDLHSTPV